MIPVNRGDLDPDLREEYDAISRELEEIERKRQRLDQRVKDINRWSDTKETYEESLRLSALEGQIAERESACIREKKQIERRHIERNLEKTVERRQRNPSNELIAETEKELREALNKLKAALDAPGGESSEERAGGGANPGRR